ncbi:MAG: response regulator [Acetobacteraceae bacterium]|nr:response regulator [Acetobacteraceae bacterium]MSP29015.1 response regulator [Acetobacteraceae bacterium]
MTVSRHLLIVALLSLLPSTAAGLFTQFSLQTRRTGELSELAMRQAELSEADLLSIIDTARQLGVIATRFTEVEQLQPECAQQLSVLHTRLARYAFLGAYRRDGTLACSSVPQLAGDNPPWLPELADDERSSVGQLARQPGFNAPILPIGTPILDASGQRNGTVIIAIDLDWLNLRQGELRHDRTQQLARTALIIADRGRRIIARHPPFDAPIPLGNGLSHADSLNDTETELAARPVAGLAQFTGPDGIDLLTAYVPFAAHREPFYVRVGLSLHAAKAEIDAIALRGAILVGAVSLIALILALAVGKAFLRRPTERLLVAAQAWRIGDLARRAPVAEEVSEFSRLAIAFNKMAASLEQRAAERERATQLLEQRVAERTAALSESNARLHVEIAEREKTDAALAQAHKLQAVGGLASGIAHDFNNLLATIMGNLELLERSLEPAQERMHTLIGRATGAVQRGAQLTSRLLAFSRRHRMVRRVVDVNQVVNDLVTLVAPTLGRRVTIETRFDPNVWPGLADPSQLEAVLLNLALNARDAMSEGGKLTITTQNKTFTVAEGTAEPGDYVRIDVTDNGTGMSAEVMARAFEPFFTTKGPAGSGLGLSQVYGIAQQSGGTVRLHSVLGQGTTVSVLLPRTTAPMDDAAIAGAPQRLPENRTVLLVDDDPPVRQATAEMLLEFGCTVVEADSGEEAMRILRNPGDHTLGLLMVDYAMPGLTGVQVAIAARNLGYKFPILLITGYAEFRDPSEPGFDLLGDVLRKPFSAQDLESTLARLMSELPVSAVRSG